MIELSKRPRRVNKQLMHGIFIANYIASSKIRLDFPLGPFTPFSRFSKPLLAVDGVHCRSEAVQRFHLPIETKTFHARSSICFRE
jgi:hypothetical protein